MSIVDISTNKRRTRFLALLKRASSEDLIKIFYALERKGLLPHGDAVRSVDADESPSLAQSLE